MHRPTSVPTKGPPLTTAAATCPEGAKVTRTRIDTLRSSRVVQWPASRAADAIATAAAGALNSVSRSVHGLRHVVTGKSAIVGVRGGSSLRTAGCRGGASATGSRTAKLIKGARLLTVKDGPHCITWTHAEEVNAELLSFLGETAGVLQKGVV